MRHSSRLFSLKHSCSIEWNYQQRDTEVSFLLVFYWKTSSLREEISILHYLLDKNAGKNRCGASPENALTCRTQASFPFGPTLNPCPFNYSTADDFLWKSFEHVLHHGAEWLGLAGVAALPSSTRTASAFALFPAPPQWVGWRWARIWAGSQPGQPSQMEQRAIPCCTTSQSAIKGFLRKQTLLRSWLDLLVYLR